MRASRCWARTFCMSISSSDVRLSELNVQLSSVSALPVPPLRLVGFLEREGDLSKFTAKHTAGRDAHIVVTVSDRDTV